MTKKVTKRFKRITSIALAMMMLVGMALPGLADGGDLPPVTEAAITKILEMPVGTDIPKYTFDFLVKGVMEDGVDADELEWNMPVVGTAVAGEDNLSKVSITFDGSEYIADNGEDEINGNPATGIKIVKAESAELFGGVEWPHTGIYVYEIIEAKDTIDLSNYDENGKLIADSLDNELTYSKAQYKVEVYVAEVANPDSGEIEYKVVAISAELLFDDDGVEGDGKVNPEPGKGIGGKFSEMSFKNIFVKNNGGGTPDPEDPEDPEIEDILKFSVLDLIKNVGGDLGDTSKLFDFEVTLRMAATGVEADRIYYAYVINEAGTQIIKPYKFIAGEKVDVKLSDGQKLVFINMPVGTFFEVKELGSPNYLANYTLVLNGNTKTETNNKVIGSDLSVPEQFIGEALNSVTYQNNYDYTTPGGISVDNLPYIVMIAAAMFALAALTVLKYRKGSKASA